MRNYILFPAVAMLLCASSFAQDSNNFQINNDFSENQMTVYDTVKNKKEKILDEVSIISNQQRNSVSATRSGTKPMDLPAFL